VMDPSQQSAIIGVSLDSKSFTREWVRYAISHTLAKHRDVELFLGDRLLSYNKTLRRYALDFAVDFETARRRMAHRSGEVASFLQSEIARLRSDDRARIRITNWTHYSDSVFQDLFRHLQIAYAALPAFRACVSHDVLAHFTPPPQANQAEVSRVLSALYVVEETAMLIRITEMADRPYDYYPENQIFTLDSLYADEFVGQGLSIETLTGKPKARVFTPLPGPGLVQV